MFHNALFVFVFLNLLVVEDQTGHAEKAFSQLWLFAKEELPLSKEKTCVCDLV